MPSHLATSVMTGLLYTHWKGGNTSDVSQFRSKLFTVFLFNVSVEYMSVVMTHGASPIPLDASLNALKVAYDVNGSSKVQVHGVLEKLLLWYPFWVKLHVSECHLE
jgi:hypothetical protein